MDHTKVKRRDVKPIMYIWCKFYSIKCTQFLFYQALHVISCDHKSYFMHMNPALKHNTQSMTRKCSFMAKDMCFP